MSEKINHIARQLRGFLNREKPKPAATVNEFVAPIVSFAIARLRRTAPAGVRRILAPSVWSTLSADLASRLALSFGPTWRLEQCIAQAVEQSLGKANARSNHCISLDEVIRDFPGTLETATHLVASWIDAQCELLRRLWRDKNLFRENCARGEAALRVVAIRPGLSDSHCGGRSVSLLKFAGNRQVVYKPRTCDGEQSWFSALSWLARNGIGDSFRIPKLYARQSYSWMEFLRIRGCATTNSLHNFYFRWGVQTALAQVLGASDLHRENWLAIASQPILVDVEFIGEGDQEPLSSLLQTGLLPLTTRDRVGSYRGIAPFDAAIVRPSLLNCWPRLAGIRQLPAKYINDLVRGFETVTELFANRQRARQFFDKIILPISRRSNGRVLFRASSVYARLLRCSLEPDKMISPGQRWRWLARECCATAANRVIGLAEARALRRCDIPKFTARARTISWPRFLAAVAGLRSGARVLRQRVLLGVARSS